MYKYHHFSLEKSVFTIRNKKAPSADFRGLPSLTVYFLTMSYKAYYCRKKNL